MRLDPNDLDTSLPLVMASSRTLRGFLMGLHDRVFIVAKPDERGEIDEETARRLWGRGVIMYERDILPTPVETPQQAAARLVVVDDLGDAAGGDFMVLAPWQAAETFPDRASAEKRRDELVAAGVPTDAGTPVDPGNETPAQPPAPRFTYTDGSNGRYEISGPGLAESIKVRGRKALDETLAKLEAGQPITGSEGDASED